MLREGGGVGRADDVAHCAARAIVEDEARGGGEVDVGFVPEVGADCAGGVVGDGGVEGGEKLWGEEIRLGAGDYRRWMWTRVGRRRCSCAEC